MVKSCSAYGCQNRFVMDSEIHFFIFPKNEEMKKKWLLAMRREGFEPSKHTVICSEHFLEKDYLVRPGSYRKMLKPDAIPTVFPAFPSYYQPPAKKSRPARKQDTSSLPKDVTSTPSTSKAHVETSEIDVATPPPMETKDVEYIEVGLNDETINVGTQTDEKALPNFVAQLERKQTILKKKETHLKRKIKTLNQKVRRKTAKIRNLKDLVQSMKKQGLAGDDLENLLLSEFSGTSKEIFLNASKNQATVKGGQRYSQELKKFALTLYYNSPRAYKFCRPLLKLPHPSSLANWISNVDAEPGFLRNVFERLRDLPEDSKDCTLIIDGMSIRKQILNPPGTYDTVGYCDFGGEANIEGTNVPATEALVFMLVGLKVKWKWPIGYFLQNKCSSTIQASLIKSSFHLSKQVGLRVHGVTFDGTSTNLATLNSLGCKFYGDCNELKTDFTFNNEQYFAIPDPCHMLKLARNCLSTWGKLKSTEGVIDWSFIVKLHTLQNSVGLKFANKLSRAHVEWKLNKMKVKLAAQTLSTSVADAIEFLNKEGIFGFQGSEETVKFIRNIDRLFDFLNSRSPFEKGSKAAITKSNYESQCREMMGIVEYLYSLTTIGNIPLYQSDRKTFVIGFGAAVKSILAVSKSLLNDSDNFKFVLSYKFSQDHIETFFSKIRQRHGFNNNPNVLQLKWAIRQILLRNEISASALGNSLFSDSDPSGSVFDIRWKKKNASEHIDDLDEERDDDFPFDIDVSSTASGENSMLKDNILYYICGFIVRKIIKRIHCLNCKASLVVESDEHGYSSRGEHTQLVHLKDHGGLVRVSEDVFRTVQLAERVFFIALNKTSLSHVDNHFMENCTIVVKNELSFDKVFDKCQDVSDFRCHKVELIKYVCKMYYKN